MLEAALAAGLASAGVTTVLGGVLPTPAVAELVANDDSLAAGIVISASHNPFADNGIKLFGSDGFKLLDAIEAEVEALITQAGPRPTGAGVADIELMPAAAERYLELLLGRIELDLSGLRIAIDCANGATVATAEAALIRLGAKVDVVADTPDGININVACGSTHPELLSATVRAGGHDLGLAFDGDGDRVLAVDANGDVVDGDQILALLALDLKGRGQLPNNTVVTTTMTNLGFRTAMKAEGIEVSWTDVGDRYVLAEMRAKGHALGGEQSGHVINLAHGPTGDGLAAGLQLIGAVQRRGESMVEAAKVMSRLPQRLISLRVERLEGLAAATEVWDAVAACEAELGETGRVVVRASGTEPLVRVMVEAPTETECKHWCDTIVASCERVLGAA